MASKGDRQGTPERSGSRLSHLWRLSSLGLELGFCVAIGLLAGWWVDGKLQTGGGATLLGILIGLAAAALSFVRSMRAAMRDIDSDDG